jgi:hypothetical protein
MIYRYSLIYFILRDDTYVIFLYFVCSMIIGEFTVGVRILLEKGPLRYHIYEDQQFQENTQKIIFHQKTEVARRRGQGEPLMSTHASILVDSVGPPSAEVCRTAASFP